MLFGGYFGQALGIIEASAFYQWRTGEQEYSLPNRGRAAAPRDHRAGPTANARSIRVTVPGLSFTDAVSTPFSSLAGGICEGMSHRVSPDEKPVIPCLHWPLR